MIDEETPEELGDNIVPTASMRSSVSLRVPEKPHAIVQHYLFFKRS